MRALIVEDEIPASEELNYLIQEHSQIEVVDCLEDGLDVLKFLQEQEVDVIFLDINIPSLDGMMLAHHIGKFASKPYIVFTTAYKEHAAEAFELEAFDYILKPYDEKRIAAMVNKLETAFRRDHEQVKRERGSDDGQAHHAAQVNDEWPASTMQARESNAQTGRRINLLRNDNIIVTDTTDIYYAEAQEKVTKVYTKNGEFTMPVSISDFHGRLPQETFFRCHRSYVVNLSQIREIVPWFNNTYLLSLRDLEAEVPVSRGKVKEFRQLMRI
ncbi:LytTR family DNA-binding domain-containing protein [Paenibacillus sp. UMB7766-LJ446]|uniref:LytR/AlgR family response regulator transcription factor n=1 Tax=Paenibacillus sp. UMB7766-LJ446 TaxID=3046313 RepID=UPI00254ED3A2|nr:LytTR family DNA-binding domain-containing protein [Paenibacillus sp. UMB7766-LJ446]MDK8192364.1 LytTR family DNA-binding domain-containing protein [Paenibacillus sp. UMB7766-LJ446]